MPDQLSPAKRRNTEQMIADLEEQRDNLSRAIDVLRWMLGPTNGVTPQHTPRPEKTAARIVAGAKQMFANRVVRRSPEMWQAAILQILREANGTPVPGIEIGRQLSPNRRSGNFFGHINTLVKKKLIVRVNDHKPAAYRLSSRVTPAQRKSGPAPSGKLPKRVRQRQRTADALNTLSATEPRHVKINGLGRLVANGYVKRAKGIDGDTNKHRLYLRTEKPYDVNAWGGGR